MNYTVTTREAVIAADEFVERYRDVDRFHALCTQCPSYGKVWSCPPFDFDPRTRTDDFKMVTVIGTTIEFDKSVRQAGKGSRVKAKDIADQAMRQVWSTLLPELHERERQVKGCRAFTFRCSLCQEGCTRSDGLPCRHPELMRNSLESVGFDITTMARDLLGIELEWSCDGSLPAHITLVTALMYP